MSRTLESNVLSNDSEQDSVLSSTGNNDEDSNWSALAQQELKLKLDGKNQLFIDEEDYEKYNETIFSPLLRQILAASGPILITICGAMVSGYSAILLPQLKEEGTIPLTNSIASWIASMAALPMAFGCLFGGWSMEQFGRINSNLLASILATAGWSFIYFANSVEYLLIGRLITGFCLGVSCPGATCYVGEMSHPRYRGLFLSATALGIAVGLFLTHLLGTYLHWKTVALITAFLPIIQIAAFLAVPESHVWYAKRGNIAKAKSAFYWFRGYNPEAHDEIRKILEDQQQRAANQKTWSELLHECCKEQFVKPFLILNLYFITAQLTGNNAVIFYSISITQHTVPSLDKYASTLIIDGLRVAMSVIGCVLAKKYRVRPLTMISGFGSAVSLFCLALLVYLSEAYHNNQFLQILPLFGLMVYIILIGSALISLPWAICGELFPPATRGVGGGASLFINFLAFFVVVKTSPDLFEAFGTGGTFVVYGVAVLIGTCVLYFVLPETKNKTLKDIEGFFTTKKP